MAKKIAASLAAVLSTAFPATLSVAAGAQDETSTTPTVQAVQYDNSETANMTDPAACETVEVDTIDSETAALRGLFSVGEEGEEVYYTAECEPAYLAPHNSPARRAMRGIVWDAPLIPQRKLSISIGEGLNLTAPTLRPRGVWRHQRTQSSAAGGIDCSKVAPCIKRSGCLYSIIPRRVLLGNPPYRR